MILECFLSKSTSSSAEESSDRSIIPENIVEPIGWEIPLACDGMDVRIGAEVPTTLTPIKRALSTSWLVHEYTSWGFSASFLALLALFCFYDAIWEQQKLSISAKLKLLTQERCLQIYSIQGSSSYFKAAVILSKDDLFLFKTPQKKE